MRRVSFQRPTEHYDERLIPIDEQICALLKQRKELSNADPGFPPFEYVARWAAANGLYEDYLKSVFGAFMSEEHFRPRVEPSGFKKHIPVLRTAADPNGAYFYTVTSVRQYGNASVLTFTADWDVLLGEEDVRSRRPPHFELSIGGREDYDCRFEGGGSTSGHSAFNYVVAPALPDDLSGMAFVFRAYDNRLKHRPSGSGDEVVIRVD